MELALEQCEAIFESVRDLLPALENEELEDDEEEGGRGRRHDHQDEVLEDVAKKLSLLSMENMENYDRNSFLSERRLESSSERFDYEQDLVENESASEGRVLDPNVSGVSTRSDYIAGQAGNNKLSLLSIEDLNHYGLVQAVQTHWMANRRDTEDEYFETEEEEDDGAENSEFASVLQDDDDEGFIRIPVSEEEFWDLHEQVWEINHDGEIQQDGDDYCNGNADEEEVDYEVDEAMLEQEEAALGLVESDEEDEFSDEKEELASADDDLGKEADDDKSPSLDGQGRTIEPTFEPTENNFQKGLDGHPQEELSEDMERKARSINETLTSLNHTLNQTMNRTLMEEDYIEDDDEEEEEEPRESPGKLKKESFLKDRDDEDTWNSDNGTAMLERKVRAQERINIYDSFELRIINERRRTGFEATKDLKVQKGMVLAGQYEVDSIVGEAAFSRALKCYDLGNHPSSNPRCGRTEVCIKVIKNKKEYFDQSLDEIRLLKHLNSAGDPDEKRIVKMFDYFYHKEHLFIVTELLGMNLYSACKLEIPLRGTESSQKLFTLPNIRCIAQQCLEALTYVSSLGIIHCDLKPENILLKSRDPVQIKIIDFGSSCFTTDHLSSYIQSRFYRAPEVVIGAKYDQRIDVWSLGCVLAEIYSGEVLFEAQTGPTLLAKIVSILGPFSKNLLQGARFAQNLFLGDVIIEKRDKNEGQGGADLLYPRKSNLFQKLRAPPQHRSFVRFLRTLLVKNPAQRPSADLARTHSWLVNEC